MILSYFSVGLCHDYNVIEIVIQGLLLNLDWVPNRILIFSSTFFEYIDDLQGFFPTELATRLLLKKLENSQIMNFREEAKVNKFTNYILVLMCTITFHARS